MSIQDRIRDEIYGSSEDRQELQDYADGAASLLESTEHPHIVGRRLIFAIAAELLIAAFAIFKPSLVIDILAGYLLFLPVLAFALGFFIAFSLFRMYQQAFARIEEPKGMDGGVMSGYAGFDSRSRHNAIWFVSAAGALINVGVLSAVAWFF